MTVAGDFNPDEIPDFGNMLAGIMSAGIETSLEPRLKKIGAANIDILIQAATEYQEQSSDEGDAAHVESQAILDRLYNTSTPSSTNALAEKAMCSIHHMTKTRLKAKMCIKNFAEAIFLERTHTPIPDESHTPNLA